jgi:hypothetical protein
VHTGTGTNCTVIFLIRRVDLEPTAQSTVNILNHTAGGLTIKKTALTDLNLLLTYKVPTYDTPKRAGASVETRNEIKALTEWLLLLTYRLPT